MIRVILALAISVLFATACLRSNVQTDRAYNELGRAQHFQLVRDGFVVGIEKRKMKLEDGQFLAGLETDAGYTERFTAVDYAGESGEKRSEKYNKVTTGQKKVMLVTQITQNTPHQHYLYNAYEDRLEGEYDYERSFAEVDNMFVRLREQLKNSERPYTHVLIMSMGWNNDQIVSLYRYNKILKNLSTVASEHGDPFNPLVIAFTWPSAWTTISDSFIRKKTGHLFSYFNKANDADEIGFTWANWIINHKLPQAIDTANLQDPPKTVVIGHSFGARLLSRAVFASQHIKEEHESYNRVDLFLGLQGAFSANRFLNDGGNEGGPYSDFEDLAKTKIVLTTSENDRANPFAYWITRAGHVGGERGLKIAKENDGVFAVETWDKQSPTMSLPNNAVLLIDATSIVEDNKDSNDKTILSAHNDILDVDMAKLMWNFIRQIP